MRFASSKLERPQNISAKQRGPPPPYFYCGGPKVNALGTRGWLPSGSPEGFQRNCAQFRTGRHRLVAR